MLGLRSLYFALAGMIDEFRYLKVSLALVLMLVGVKMLIHSWLKEILGHHFNLYLLAMVLLILFAGVAASDNTVVTIESCTITGNGDGITGLGQSSWGPTGFAFAASEAEGQALLAAARAYAGGASLRFELAQGRNEPAIVEGR